MKISRKVLSILLILMLLIPNTAFASYGEGSIKLLEDFGIAGSSGMSYFQQSYTRADFASMLCAIDRAYLPGISDTSIVKDATDETKDVIAYVVSKNYLSLDKDGKFKPDDNVTYNDAVKALVTLLGYDSVAELSGGKLANYIATARKIKLTSGIPASNDKYISKADLASMIVNAMEITPATLAYEDGAVIEQKTFLEHNDMFIMEGKLLATEKRGIGADACKPGYINIDGTILKADKVFDDSFVGREIFCYVRTGEGKDVAVAMVNMGGESITIEPKDITYTNVGRTYTDIKYGNKEKVRIPHTAAISINGRPGDLSNALFAAFNSGSIELIDSDNDGDFDTVDMTICVTEIVESASAEDKTINTKYTRRYIDLDGNDNAVAIYEGGEAVEMDAIRPGSVLSIACDRFTLTGGVLTFDYANANFVKVYVSNRKVTGVLEYTTDDGEYGIDGRNFKALPYLTTIENGGTKNKLAHGNTYTFSLDYFGKLTDYEVSGDENAMQYGYLMLADDNTAGFDTTAKIRVLTPAKELKIYPIRNKYIVDGQKFELGKDAFPATLSQRQLIRYRVVDGEVIEIDTSDVKATYNEVAATSLDVISEDLADDGHGNMVVTPTAKVYFSKQKTLAYKYSISDNTIIFVKITPATGEADKDENYAIGSTNDLGSTDSPAKSILYDVDDMGAVGCIVVVKEAGSADRIFRSEKTYMVEKVTKSTDEAGDEVYKILAHGYNGTVTLTTIEASEIDAKCYDYDHKAVNRTGAPVSGTAINVSDIRKGDLVRYSQNAISKRVEGIERVFAFDTDKADYNKPKYKRGVDSTDPDLQPSSSNDDPRAGVHFAYGKLYQSNDTHLMFTAYNDLSNIPASEKFLFAFKDASRIPVYNLADGTISVIGADYQRIPTYLSTAKDVRVFVQINIYEVPSIAVYVMN